jgi:uncharacterized membrane protein
MLSALIDTLRPSFEAAVVLAAAAVLTRAVPNGSSTGGQNARLGRLAASAPLLSLALACIVTGGLAFGLFTKVFDREMTFGFTSLAALGIGTLMLAALAVRRLPSAVAMSIGAVGPVALRVPRGLTLSQLQSVRIDSFADSEAAVAAAGSALGLVAGAVVAFALMRVATASDRKARMTVALPLTALLAAQASHAVNMAFLLGLLPIDPTLVGLAAPLMNAGDRLFYGVVIMVVAVSAWRMIRPAHLLDPSPRNPAEARLSKARRRSERRISSVALGVAVVSLSVGVGQSVLAARAEAATALTVPTELEPQGDELWVTESDVSDGQMHRFQVTVDGSEVRFIVVHKGSGLYGAGLDACEICGPTGYYQRADDVVCKACDVVIPIPTIGFEGGCNPIPLEYEKRDGALVFDMAQMRDGIDEFE